MHVERMAETSAEVLGRKTYDLMRYWESAPEDGSWTAAEHEFARRWQTIEKVVVSTTMSPDDLSSDRSRLIRELDTAELRQLTESAPGSVEIFGPTTAATAIRAGMVSGFRLFVVPVIVGGDCVPCPPTQGSTFGSSSSGPSPTAPSICTTPRSEGALGIAICR